MLYHLSLSRRRYYDDTAHILLLFEYLGRLIDDDLTCRPSLSYVVQRLQDVADPSPRRLCARYRGILLLIILSGLQGRGLFEFLCKMGLAP